MVPNCPVVVLIRTAEELKTVLPAIPCIKALFKYPASVPVAVPILRVLLSPVPPLVRYPIRILTDSDVGEGTGGPPTPNG